MSIKNEQKKVVVFKKRLLWALMIFTAGLIVFQFSRVWADQVTGTIKGGFQNVNGTATYSIPIPVTPGSNGMGPNVSLNYNARGGDGIVGIGWSLDAGLMITKGIHNSERSAGYDNKRAVAYDDTDQLLFKGRALKLISDTPHMQEEAVYMAEIDMGVQFVRTTQGFIGKTKDGQIITFDMVWSVNGKTVGWLASSVNDAYGNTITYCYEAGLNSPLVPYIDKIKFSEHYPDNGFAEYNANKPHGKTTQSVVDFRYTTYSSKTKIIVGEDTLYNTRLLESIVISPRMPIVPDDLTFINDYQIYNLTYEDALSGSGVKRLKSIQAQEKRDDQLYTMNATTFDYNDSDALITGDFSQVQDISIGSTEFSGNKDDKADASQLLHGDFNGDGILDSIAIVKNNNHHEARLFINDGTGQLTLAASKELSTWQDRTGQFNHRFHAADVDEDGKSELIEVYLARNSINTRYEICATSWDYDGNGIVAIRSGEKMVTTRYMVSFSEQWANSWWESTIVDWNADGRGDLVIYGKLNNLVTGLYVSPHLNQGNDSFEGNVQYYDVSYSSVTTYDADDYRRSLYQFMDVNDDGKPDLVEIFNESLSGPDKAHVGVFLNIGEDGINTQRSGGLWDISNWPHLDPDEPDFLPEKLPRFKFADMNMDGRTDIVVVNRDFRDGDVTTEFFYNNGKSLFKEKRGLAVTLVDGLTQNVTAETIMNSNFFELTPYHIIADFNSDGYQDIMVATWHSAEINDTNDGIVVKAYFEIFENDNGTIDNTADFTQILETDGDSWLFNDLGRPAPPLQAVNFNKDNAIDLVEIHTYQGQQLIRNWARGDGNYHFPDLLKTITNGMGVVTAVEYATANDGLTVHGADFYTSSSSSGIDDQFDAVPQHYLVKGYTVKQSNGDLVANSVFRYEGLKYHFLYGSLGFENVYSYNELTNHFSEIQYHQDFPKIGLKKVAGYYNDVSRQTGVVDYNYYTAQNYPGTNDVWMLLPDVTERGLVEGGVRVGGPADRMTQFTSDTYGRITTKIESFGGNNSEIRHLKTIYTYDSNSPDNTGNISVANQDAFHLGFFDTKTMYESDSSGAVVDTDSRRIISYTYTAGLKVASVTTQLENVEDNITVSYGYDNYGNIIKETGGEGFIWKTTIDAYGLHPSSKTNPLGHIRTFEAHDLFTGTARRIKDENYVTHTIKTGPFGRQGERFAPYYTPPWNPQDGWGSPTGQDITTHKMSYGSNVISGYVRKTWDSDFIYRTSYRKHDDLGRVITEARSDTPYNEITYGADGKPETKRVVTTTGSFTTLEYEYDDFMNQSKITRDDVILSEINRENDLGKETHKYPSPADDQTISSEIIKNVLGKIGKRTLPSGDIHTYTYNIYGEVTSITDPTNQTQTFDYDMAGRMIEKYTTETGTISFDYDKRSLPVRRTNTDDKVVEMVYDALGRVTHRYTQGNLADSWHLKEMEYDNTQYSFSLGQMTDVFMKKSTNGRDDGANWQILAQYSFNYDMHGNVSTQTRMVLNGNSYDTYAFQSTYHPDGTPDTVTYPDGSKVRYDKSAHAQVSYNNFIKTPMIYEIYYAENGTDFVRVKRYDKYNLHGQNTESTLTAHLRSLKTIDVDSTYDEYGQPLSKTMEDNDYGQITAYESVAQRNESGFITEVNTRRKFGDDDFNYTTTYDYMDEGWLISADNTDPNSYGQETYTYLSDGRRDTDQTYKYIYRNGHQLMMILDSDRVYEDGQISRVINRWDSNGAQYGQTIVKWNATENRELLFQKREFTYDAENMPETQSLEHLLTETWASTGSRNYTDRDMSFSYDHTGQRFYKELNATGITSSGLFISKTKTFYLTPGFVAEETTINGNSTMEYTKYIIGPDGVIASLKRSDLNAGSIASIVPFNSRWMAADMYRWDHPVSAVKKIVTYTHALMIHPKTAEWVYMILKVLPAIVILAILISLLIGSAGRTDLNSFRYRYPVLARATWVVLIFFAIELMPTLHNEVFASGTTSGEVYETYLKDINGNTAVTLRADKYSYGYSVASQIAYRPFGAVDFGASSNAEATRYTYSGKEIDFVNSANDDQGPVYFGARFYDSFSGRFLTPDPKAQFTDPYMYCWNSPQNATDPDGQLAMTTGLVIAYAIIMASAIGLTLGGLTLAWLAREAGDDKAAQIGEKVWRTALGVLIFSVGAALGFGIGFGMMALASVALPTAAALVGSSLVTLGIVIASYGAACRVAMKDNEWYGNMMMYFGVGLIVAGLGSFAAVANPFIAEAAFAGSLANAANYSVGWYFGGCGGGGSWDPTKWDYSKGKVWGWSFAQAGLDFAMQHAGAPIKNGTNAIMKSSGKWAQRFVSMSTDMTLGGINGMMQHALWSIIGEDSPDEAVLELCLGFAAGAGLGIAGGLLGKRGGGIKKMNPGFKRNFASGGFTFANWVFGIGGVVARVSMRDAVSQNDALAWF